MMSNWQPLSTQAPHTDGQDSNPAHYQPGKFVKILLFPHFILLEWIIREINQMRDAHSCPDIEAVIEEGVFLPAGPSSIYCTMCDIVVLERVS